MYWYKSRLQSLSELQPFPNTAKDKMKFHIIGVETSPKDE